jgi:hypothetical protein
MRPRPFALALLTAAAAVLAATVAANILLDPQRVFGTPLVGIDENANYRYLRLRQYQAAAGTVDALLFASSRGRAFAPDITAQSMGARAVGKFDVTAGMMTDHLPALQYVLRDKAARGERIKEVLLLLDVDSFGKLPATNVNIDSFLPPEESGEHPVRFWWRYLTVFQLRMWRGMLAERWRGQLSARPMPSLRPDSVAPRQRHGGAADRATGEASGRHATQSCRPCRAGAAIRGALPRPRRCFDGCHDADARRRPFTL